MLRDLAMQIGFQIDTGPLQQADQMTDDFKANALGAESTVGQLGASIADVGISGSASIGAVAETTTALGAEVEATAAGPFQRFKEWGSQAVDTVKGKFEEHRDQIEQIGKTLKENRVIIGAVFGLTAGVLGMSVNTAANFEAAMSRVGAVSQASEGDMERLTKTARELGATTIFSASQAAEGMTYLSMAGFDVNQTIAAMPGLLDTAAAAQMDLGATADIVSNILSGFNIDAEETGRVADVLTATFTSSNTTLGSLGETMKMVAPVAASLGVELEDVGAMAAVLGDKGIHGTMAGTALRNVLTSLAAPTGAAAKQLQQLGVQTTDAAGNMLPLTSIFDQIATSTAHMGDAQRAAALETLVGVQGITAMTALLDVGADAIDDYAESLRNSAGIAGITAARQMDNLRGAMTQLGSAIEGAKISLGSALIPAIRIGANALTKLVGIFNALPEPLKGAVAIGLGFVAMLSGAALAASLIIPQIGAMVKGFALLKSGLAVVTAVGTKAGVALGAAFWPVVLGIGAVVAVGLVLQDVFMALRGDGDTLTARLFNWGARLLGFTATWGDAVARIKGWFGGLIDDFKGNPIGFLIDWSPFGLLRRGTESLLGWFGDWLESRGIKLPEFHLPTFPDLIGWAMTPINTFMEWLSDLNFGAVIGEAIGGAWSFITSPLEGLTEKIRDWFPFSPAKVGPLSDLDRVGLGLVDTVAGSIDAAGSGRIDDALSDVLGGAAYTPSDAPDMSGSFAAGTPRSGPSIDINVNVNASGATAEDAEQIGRITASRIREAFEQLVAEAYHTAVLEEI